MNLKNYLSRDLETLHYYDSEKGKETLLLLHGFPFCWEMWSPQIPELEKKYRLLIPNLRAMGESGVETQFSMEMMVDDVIQLIIKLDLPKIHALGFSMGGYVLLRALEKKPELFKSVILASTQSAADSDEGRIKRTAAIYKIKEQGLAAFTKDFLPNAISPSSLKKDADLHASLTQVILKSRPRAAIAELLAMMGRTDTTPSLAKITVPVLIIVGEDDIITPVSVAKKMNELIPNSKLEIIPTVGHMCNWESKEKFNKSLAHFLSKSL
jgi:3-oxoadipate enol-lactonase